VDDKDLSVLVRGAEATCANAEELFLEAVMLREAGHLSRGCFLHQISMEECDKVEILGPSVVCALAGLKRKLDTEKLRRALASHRAKNLANADLLEPTEEQKHAWERKDWEGYKAASTLARHGFHEYSNWAKNAALYVDIDIRGGNVTTPRDSITVEMVAKIAKLNESYLRDTQRNVRMLLEWEKGTRPDVRQLIERIKHLTKEMPDDPQKVWEVIMEELWNSAYAERMKSALAKRMGKRKQKVRTSKASKRARPICAFNEYTP
jgi:AbiV family abortive infection protein